MNRSHRRVASLRRTVAEILLTTLIFAVVCAAGAQAAPVGGDQTFEQQANGAVDRVAREDGFSGAILVARGDRILLRRAAGFADRERKIANTPETKFPLESVTKQFTAAAILLLVEDHKISVHDPIAKFYPGLPPAWRGITIAQLLTHSSGIDDCFDCTAEGYKGALQGIRASVGPLSIAGKTTLAFTPGTGFLYSNTGYGLLASVIERAGGESYGQFVRSRIFSPLRMRNSRFGEMPDDPVKGYIRSVSGGREIWQDGVSTKSKIFAGFGGIYSTVDDMLAWNRALQGNTLLSPTSRKAMFTDYGYNYGFGWRFATKFGRRLTWHAGAYPSAGHASLLDSFPQEGLTVIAFTNNTGLTDAMATIVIGGKLTTYPANATRKLVDEVESLYFTGASAALHRQSCLPASSGLS